MIELTEKQSGHILALMGDLRIGNEKLVLELHRLQEENIGLQNKLAQITQQLVELQAKVSILKGE